MEPNHSAALRAAAFAHLETLRRRYGPVLPWGIIEEGFPYDGRRVRLANKARGIFRPKEMDGPALSIKTVRPRAGRSPRYEDLMTYGGALTYALQGTDPTNRDNRLLEDAWKHQSPLIYLYGVAPGHYMPMWPAYLQSFDAAAMECAVTIGDAQEEADTVTTGSPVVDRRYTTGLAKRRLHQGAFRYHVLEAYQERCAVCRLPNPALLEAAHIVPDREIWGAPEVPNGLALCRLHHGVYDADLMGIDPDGQVHISPPLLAAKDGPTLELAVKAFHGQTIRRPRDEDLWPNPERLAWRFDQFRQLHGGGGAGGGSRPLAI